MHDFTSSESLRSSEESLLALVAPFVFLANLLFFFRREIILDVEGFADFFRCFAFDHVGHRLASQVQEVFDFEEIGRLFKKELIDCRKDFEKNGRNRIGKGKSGGKRTKINSKRAGWSNLPQNSLSQGIMSSVRRSSFLSSEGGTGNCLWYCRYSSIRVRLGLETLIKGMATPEDGPISKSLT